MHELNFIISHEAWCFCLPCLVSAAPKKAYADGLHEGGGCITLPRPQPYGGTFPLSYYFVLNRSPQYYNILKYTSIFQILKQFVVRAVLHAESLMQKLRKEGRLVVDKEQDLDFLRPIDKVLLCRWLSLRLSTSHRLWKGCKLERKLMV